MAESTLLMIPGPIELSPAVLHAFGGQPPSHLAPDFIEAFGSALESMRRVWRAADNSQPYAIAGSGTIAMEMAVTNLLDPGQKALVVNTGYFSDRMSEMLRRRGVEVAEVGADFGDAPSVTAIADALGADDYQALFATHVDTSTGVRVDARTIAGLARDEGVLSVFDGVCATAAETFEMADWGVDVYLTGSQKAVGVPPGLALMVVSMRALEARSRLAHDPPMSIDWEQWEPIMDAYEGRAGSYFSTPATNLINALHEALAEILDFGHDGAHGIAARVLAHQQAADGMRAAWEALGLELVPARPELCANTLSAIRYPSGVGPELLADVKRRGVVVAGGLYPGHQRSYFRVGHMGHVVTQPLQLARTVRAIGEALQEHDHACDVDRAVAAIGAGA